MSLKDDLLEDIDVFLDLDEFGETLRYNDKEIIASLEEISSEEYKEKMNIGPSQPIYKRYYRLFTRTTALADRMPQSGDWIMVNEQRMSVIRCKPEFGIVTVELGCNDS